MILHERLQRSPPKRFSFKFSYYIKNLLVRVNARRIDAMGFLPNAHIFTHLPYRRYSRHHLSNYRQEFRNGHGRRITSRSRAAVLRSLRLVRRI